MENSFNYIFGIDYLISLINGGKKSFGIIITSDFNHGVKNTVRMIEREAYKSSRRVYTNFTLGRGEVVRFQPFNELLNNIENKFNLRNLNQIVDEIDEIFNGDENCIMILSNIEKYEEDTFNLLMYLLNSSGKSNIRIIGIMINDPNNQQSKSRMENMRELSKINRNIEIIKIKDVTDSDAKTLFKNAKLNLSSEFIRDLMIMSRKNLDVAFDAIEYYKQNYIIDSRGNLNQSLIRQFPIPSAIEDRIEEILKSLSIEEIRFLYAIGSLGPEFNMEILERIRKVFPEFKNVEMDKFLGLNLYQVESGIAKISNTFIYEMVEKLLNEQNKNSIIKKIWDEQILNKDDLYKIIFILYRLKKYDELARMARENYDAILLHHGSPDKMAKIFEDVLKENKEEKYRSAVEFLCAHFYIDMKRYDLAEKFLNENNRKENPLKWYRMKIKINYGLENYQTTNDLISEASKMGFPEPELQEIISLRISILVDRGKFSEAKREIEEFTGKGKIDDATFADLLNLSGIIGITESRFEDAKRDLNKSIELSSKCRKIKTELSARNNLIVIYQREGLIREAIDNMEEVIRLSYIENDIYSRAVAVINGVELYFLTGDFEKVELYLFPLTKMVEMINFIQLRREFETFLSIYDTVRLNFKDARRHIENLRKMHENNDMPPEIVLLGEMVDELNTLKKSAMIENLSDEDLRRVGGDWGPIIMTFMILRSIIMYERDRAIKMADLAVEISTINRNIIALRYAIVTRTLIYLYFGDDEIFRVEIDKIEKDKQYETTLYTSVMRESMVICKNPETEDFETFEFKNEYEIAEKMPSMLILPYYIIARELLKRGEKERAKYVINKVVRLNQKISDSNLIRKIQKNLE